MVEERSCQAEVGVSFRSEECVVAQCGPMVDQDTMHVGRTRDDAKETKLGRVKRMITDSLCRRTRGPASFEEARALSKARKRKERQESTSSLSQERKVIRSSSEERPAVRTDDNVDDKEMRRVLSQEDFQQTLPLQEKNEANRAIRDYRSSSSFRSSPHRPINMDILDYDDCERRRTHERFALPLAPRGRRVNLGRKKKKHFSKMHHGTRDIYKENNNNNNEQPSDGDDSKGMKETATFMQMLQEEHAPTPTSISAPDLDLTTLHQQIDCADPVPSIASHEINEEIETLPSLSVASNRMLSSPRNSIMVTHRIYLDPNVPQTKSALEEVQSACERKLRHLSKQINATKKRIRQYEEEFEMQNGYKPSQADKTCDKNMRKLMSDVFRLKKEYKQLKEDGVTTDEESPRKKKEQTLEETVEEVNKKLSDKRLSSNRGNALDEMTNEEWVEEKIAVQKALLYLESLHGRPTGKDDRDLVRPLYDRYRTLKRLVAKIGAQSSNNELATILEHETMDFVSVPSISVDGDTDETDRLNPSLSTDSDTDISLGETLHNLTLDELVEQKQDTIEEKKKLKRSLREFENNFQMKTGRKLQKDDRVPMAAVYFSYKQAKAKLRLLDALVRKQVT